MTKEWWFKKKFTVPDTDNPVKLVFDGVDYQCTVWLNGQLLGSHEGPFGGPDYDITKIVNKGDNELILKLDPAPPDWKKVLKTNCVYGWHYVRMPPIGIWRDVRAYAVPPVEINDPFITARDVTTGEMDLVVGLAGQTKNWSGKLVGYITPGDLMFEREINSAEQDKQVHLRFNIPNPKLWWPNGVGEQNMYALTLSFHPQVGNSSSKTTGFAIRTIRMLPTGNGPVPTEYNWLFEINGRKIFLKGTNWCTLDAMLRLTDDRYDRFLSLAKDAHIQVLRSWGGGLLENNNFYDICDRLGIMVYQELPITWQDMNILNPAVVEETCVKNIKRLRNHPSLLMWGGGNEHSGTGPVVERFGRLCYELDGSRPYHRTDPYGGNKHDYTCWWGKAPLEYNLTTKSVFIGEFGFPSPPNIESVLRYLPENEKAVWPPPETGSFVKHTPVFNYDMIDRMNAYARKFDNTSSMAGMIRAQQMVHTTGIRHALELARTRWPESTGICYYKLTDVYPAMSWATIDYYGVPKIPHYFVQDAYAPLHAVVLFDRLTIRYDEELTAPVWLLDDTGELDGDWEVSVRAYDGKLDLVQKDVFPGTGKIDRTKKLGEFTLNDQQSHIVPLYIVVQLIKAGKLLDRTYYWLNYEKDRGCLFRLPKSSLVAKWVDDTHVEVVNTGDKPAAGVHFVCPDVSDSVTFSDNYFWLDPGEKYVVTTEARKNIEGEVKKLTKLEVNTFENYFEPADNKQYCLRLKTVNTDKNPGIVCRSIDRQWYTTQDGDMLEYDIYIPNTGNTKCGGIDLKFNVPAGGGASLRETTAVDQNKIGTHSGADLAAYATDKWYGRKIPLPDNRVGMEITAVEMVHEADMGTNELWLRNIKITNKGKIMLNVYGTEQDLNFPPEKFGPGNNGATVENMDVFKPEGADSYCVRFKCKFLGGGNMFFYRDIKHPGYTVQPGDVLEYEIYMPGTSSQKIGGIDLEFSGPNLKGTGAVDQNKISCALSADLSKYAVDKWYHRVIPIPENRLGMEIGWLELGMERITGSNEVMVRNIKITNGDEVNYYIYGTEPPSAYVYPVDFGSSLSDNCTIEKLDVIVQP
jgi:beta-mannosidase